MIAGVLLLLAANGASFLGASVLLDRVKTGDASLDTVLLLLLRLLLISGAVLFAGVTHLLTPWGLGLAASGTLLLLLATGAHRRVLRPERPSCGRWVGLLTLAVAARLAAQVWFFSPHLGDPLAYHLPKIGEWIRAGGFTREMGLHPHATFSAGFELIETWWVVFLRHDVLIEAAGLEFLALAFASVIALGRRLGLEHGLTWMAALLYVLTPGLHLSATSCLNDTPVAALVVATAALVFARAPVALVVMTAGLGIGLKATYGFVIPGIALLALLVRKEPAAQPISRPWSWSLATLGVAMGSFWFIRNMAWFGNPVYPVGEPGYRDNPLAVQVGPRGSSLVKNGLDLVGYRIYDQQTALGANVDDMAGWGPVTFASGILALMVLGLERPSYRRLGIAFVVSLVSSLLLIVHDPWCLKYVFFFPAVAVLAICPLLQAHRSVAVVAWAGLAFSLLVTILPYDLPFPEFRRLFRQEWRERSSLKEPEEIRGDQVLACYGGIGERSYLLYRPDFSRRVVYLRAERADDLRAELARCGARAGCFQPAGQRQELALEECVRRGILERIGETSFFRIRPEPKK